MGAIGVVAVLWLCILWRNTCRSSQGAGLHFYSHARPPVHRFRLAHMHTDSEAITHTCGGRVLVGDHPAGSRPLMEEIKATSHRIVGDRPFNVSK